ncbi:MAG TPA: META domain-containing protein [Candidatus Binatia bacterium]|jgi:heat shock protein HslJ|nr:META domain-containing protein [Candidatus Binatia bacterium]
MRIVAMVVLALVSACGSHRLAHESSPPLANTQWRLDRLGDTPIHVADGQHAPHLVFVPDGHRVQGSGGCNRITGTYREDGSAITIGPLASTRMACVQGMETESQFLLGLDRVRKWSITGQRLTLSDDTGRVVAMLEAVATR